MAGLAAVFIFLGNWQLQRGGEKETRLTRYSEADTYTGLPEANHAIEFSRVFVKGRFIQNRHILADNQVHKGRPGVHVYSAFNIGKDIHILVNRGWLAMGADRSLPADIETPGETIEIYGHIGPMPGPGRQLGPEDRIDAGTWPQLVTYPRLDTISGALETGLYPMVLFLDENAPAGFEGRDWKPVYMSPAKHRAYAFQWFALATAAISGWVLLGIRRGRNS